MDRLPCPPLRSRPPRHPRSLGGPPPRPGRGPRAVRCRGCHRPHSLPATGWPARRRHPRIQPASNKGIVAPGGGGLLARTLARRMKCSTGFALVLLLVLLLEAPITRADPPPAPQPSGDSAQSLVDGCQRDPAALLADSSPEWACVDN